MKDTKTTNTLLLIIVIPLIFYLLKILSFIFIPLILSMFIAVLFLPLMRWLHERKVPKPVSILVVVLIVTGVLKLGGELIQLSSSEILSVESSFFEKAETKLVKLIVSTEEFFGIDRLKGENVLIHYFQNSSTLKNVGSTLDFVMDTLSMTLMTAFFAVLLLSESINFQKVRKSVV